MNTNTLVSIDSADLTNVTGGKGMLGTAIKGIKEAAPVVKKWGGKALEWGGKAVEGINAAQSVKDAWDSVKGAWGGGGEKK